MQNEKTTHHNTTGLITCFLGGAAAGAVAMWLFAPRSGSDTRQQLVGYVDQGRDIAARVPEALEAAGTAAKKAFTNAAHTRS